MVYTARKLCGKVSHVYGVAMDSCVFNFYCLVLVDEVDCSGLSSRYVADTTRPKKSGSWITAQILKGLTMVFHGRTPRSLVIP